MQPNYAPNRRALLAGLAALLAAGCDNGSLVEPRPAPPFEGVTLRVACPDPVAREVLAAHGKVWAATRGVKLDVVARPLGDVADADLGLIAPPEISRFAASGQLDALPEAMRHPSHPYHFDRLSSAYRDKILVWDGVPVALPVLGEGFVMAYRKDRFAAAKLAPPATWDEFAAAAKHFGAGSLPPLPEGDDAFDREFFSVAATLQRPATSSSDEASRPKTEADANRLFAFHYDLVDGRSRLAQPAFVAALKWFQRVQEYRAKTPGEPVLWFATLRELAALPPGSPVGVAPVPGSPVVHDFATGEPKPTAVPINRVPYVGWGGAVGVVRKASANPEAAWDLLAYLGMAETTAPELIGAAKWGAGPTRPSQTDSLNQKFWAGYPLPPAERERLAAVLRDYVPSGLVNPVLRLRTPDQAEKVKATAAILRKAIADQGDAAAAMRGVEAAWAKLDEATPESERIALYRRSLGLGK